MRRSKAKQRRGTPGLPVGSDAGISHHLKTTSLFVTRILSKERRKKQSVGPSIRTRLAREIMCLDRSLGVAQPKAKGGESARVSNRVR
jgi:hypothetical protein